MDDGDIEAFCLILRLRAQGEGFIHTTLIRWIDNSIKNGLFTIVENDLGRKVGYVVWAQVSEETLRRLYKYREFPSYDYEWQEGVINLILDVRFGNGRYRLSRSLISKALPNGADKIAFVRRSRLRMYRRLGTAYVEAGIEQMVSIPL